MKLKLVVEIEYNDKTADDDDVAYLVECLEDWVRAGVVDEVFSSNMDAVVKSVNYYAYKEVP
jgi:hypothetical protein